jgi:hypothetical protein
MEVGSSASAAALRVMGSDEEGSLESQTVECGRGSRGNCAGEGRQRLWASPHRRVPGCLTVVKVWSRAPDGCFVPGRTGRLTVGRNMRIDSTSSCLRGNE